MENLMMFSNEEFGEIRVVKINGVEWFVAKDICNILELGNTSQALSRLDDDEKDIILNDTLGGEQKMLVITESGLYGLTLSSRKSQAKPFQRWVRKDVLPAIRKTVKALETVTYTPSDCSLVNMRDGFCYTTSKDIANVFGRRIIDVNRIIDNYLTPKEKDVCKISHVFNASEPTSDFMKKHVKEITYLDKYNRPQRAYELDEYAFSMVALSFTGEDAEAFKIAFINQFFAMRQTLLDRTKALAIEQVLPQDKKLRQYVYLIQNLDSGNIKVGVGIEPEKRVKQLQTGSDAELKLIYQSMVCSNAYDIESQMHRELEEYHIRGEWFSVDKEFIIKKLEEKEFVLNSKFQIGVM